MRIHSIVASSVLRFLGLALVLGPNTGCFSIQQQPSAPGGPQTFQLSMNPHAMGSMVPPVMVPPLGAAGFRTAAAPVSTPGARVPTPGAPVSTTPTAARSTAPAAARTTGPAAPRTQAVARTTTSRTSSTPNPGRWTAAGPGSGQTSLLGVTDGTPSSPTVASLGQRYGIRIIGYTNSEVLGALDVAARGYPSNYLQGLTINFSKDEPPEVQTDTGIRGKLRGLHEPTKDLITIWRLEIPWNQVQWSSSGIDVEQTTLVLAHEIAHHVMDKVQGNWAAGFRENTIPPSIYADGAFRAEGTRVSTSNIHRSRLPPTDYAFKSAQAADLNEVAAEMISYHALGRWTSPDGRVSREINRVLGRTHANLATSD